jgi:UDP-N-acetylmuramate dehydrogenase
MNAPLVERLRACVAASAVHEGELLAGHTTAQVGGPADVFVDVTSVDELTRVLAIARDETVPVTLIGGGSNVIVSDEGLRGIVIRLRLLSVSTPENGVVRADAGVTMNGLVRWTIGRGLAALEAWAGTPGTVGGAIYGNAHYGGRDIGGLVTRVHLVTRDGMTTTVPASEMGFAYDTSRLQRTGEIALWAEFAVTAGDPDRLRDTARASLAHRKRTQPLALPSAGCIFQNPLPGRDVLPAGVPYSAGALIDRAGLKGRRAGGVEISSVHANFFVNMGGARAGDFRQLAETARAAVRDRFGVTLRDEVVFLGTF